MVLYKQVVMGFILPGHQVPTKLLYQSPLQQDRGRNEMEKKLWFEEKVIY